MRCEHEVSVGAYVLDVLEPDEQLQMAEHVPECAVCSAAVHELEAMPRLLASVPEPAEMPEAPVPSETAYARFLESAQAQQPVRARRAFPRRWVAAAVAAAILVAAAVTGVVVGLRDPDPTVVAAADHGVNVTAWYLAANDGTKVTVAIDGAPAGRCELLAVDRSGREQSAGTWEISERGDNTWSGWVSFEPADVDRFVVRTADGQRISVPS